MIIRNMVLFLLGCNSKEDIPKSEVAIKAKRVVEINRFRATHELRECKELEKKLNWNWNWNNACG